MLSFLTLAASDAIAISPGCLPGGLPTTPGPEAVARTFGWGSSDYFHGDVWRVTCADDPNTVALLFRAIPQIGEPFVCSGSFDIIQGGQQLTVRFEQTPGSFLSFCDDLLVATTVAIERHLGAPFDPKGAFTLVFDGISAGNQSLEVPAVGGSTDLGITVVSTGCNPCSAGQTATFHVHVVNRTGRLAVELRAGIKFPNNGPQVAIFDLCTETVLETGEQDIPLASIVVPGNVPNGTYTIEAAILDPIFGTTLSRHAINATKQ
jgi:hypothetical protein